MLETTPQVEVYTLKAVAASEGVYVDSLRRLMSQGIREWRDWFFIQAGDGKRSPWLATKGSLQVEIVNSVTCNSLVFSCFEDDEPIVRLLNQIRVDSAFRAEVLSLLENKTKKEFKNTLETHSIDSDKLQVYTLQALSAIECVHIDSLRRLMAKGIREWRGWFFVQTSDDSPWLATKDYPAIKIFND
jgi:hypothetical protein